MADVWICVIYTVYLVDVVIDSGKGKIIICFIHRSPVYLQPLTMDIEQL